MSALPWYAAEPPIVVAVPAAPPREPLTEREREVLALVADGLTNHQIATALFLAPSTVKCHLQRIARKWTMSSRAGLVGIAFREGVIG